MFTLKRMDAAVDQLIFPSTAPDEINKSKKYFFSISPVASRQTDVQHEGKKRRPRSPQPGPATKRFYIKLADDEEDEDQPPTEDEAGYDSYHERETGKNSSVSMFLPVHSFRV